MDSPSLKNKYLSLVSTIKRSVQFKKEVSSSIEAKKYMRKVSRSEDLGELKNRLVYLTKGRSMEVDLVKELDGPINKPVENEIAEIMTMKEDIKRIAREFEEIKG
jgi:hypothetical protein